MNRDALRQARHRAKLSQHQLSELAGVTQPYISRLESGDRSTARVPYVRALAGALGVEAEQLIHVDQAE